MQKEQGFRGSSPLQKCLKPHQKYFRKKICIKYLNSLKNILIYTGTYIQTKLRLNNNMSCTFFHVILSINNIIFTINHIV